jgi:hypothetical protein
MNRKQTRTFLGAMLAALVLGALLAATAAAGPAWKFNGVALEKEETIVGGAEKSGLTIPGMTTTCENFLYEIQISNSGGTGKGSVTDLPLYNCTTNTKCTVKSITVKKLPWAAELKTVTGSNYIVISGINVGILYAGALCVLNGTEVEVIGTAGGKIDNSTESATFDVSSFKATGTKLEALSNEVEWKGFFPAEAFQSHREQSLTVS